MSNPLSFSKQAWSPDGFSNVLEHYPSTRWPVQSSQLEKTDLFLRNWNEHQRPPSSLAIILTPGLFAEWLPWCFRSVHKAFLANGHRVLTTPVKTSLTTPEQAERIHQCVHNWLHPSENFIWCAHSKGSLDVIQALHSHPNMAARCAGVVLMQTPAAASLVWEDMRSKPIAWLDKPIVATLQSQRFRAGMRAIEHKRPDALSSLLEHPLPNIPAIQCISWSITPTHWVDSWHKRLARLKPGYAHDGQFLLTDQLLPNIPFVGLPRLDHAQPVLGGHGLDSARLWEALSALVIK